MNFQLMTDLLDRMAGKYYHGIDMCIYKNGKEVYRKQAGVGEVNRQTGRSRRNVLSFLMLESYDLCGCSAAL